MALPNPGQSPIVQGMVDDRANADSNGDEDLGLDEFANLPEDQGLSLDALSEAYAELIDRGSEPYEPESKEEDAGEAQPEAEDDEGEAADHESCDVTPRSILEAMLFVGNASGEPLTAKHVASLMRGVRAQEIDQLVDELNELYDAEGSPYRIVSAGSGYLLRLRDEYGRLRDKFHGRVREARLSQAAIDVLALVAYGQPVTREEIDRLRGKPSGSLLSQLVRRQLLRLERTETKPRTRQYYTTDRFLDLFGLDSLAELPQSQELDRSF